MAIVTFTKNAAGPTFGPYCIDDEVDLPAGVPAKLVHATEGASTKPWTAPPNMPNATARIKKRGDSY